MRSAHKSVRYPTLLLLSLLAWMPCALPQTEFQIVWVVVGEAAGATAEEPTGAGRQLFLASELANFSLRRINVARVDVQPVVSELTLGGRLCITSLKVVAYDSQGAPIKQAPLSVSIRQDHKDLIGLVRSKKDICITPTTNGEYPVRFTSLLPAKDGSMRGAQIFVRVKGGSAG
ncbi:MAG TPA: hypothetical protein VGN07_13980 [Steroidobacteraceae bacterium]